MALSKLLRPTTGSTRAILNATTKQSPTRFFSSTTAPIFGRATSSTNTLRAPIVANTLKNRSFGTLTNPADIQNEPFVWDPESHWADPLFLSEMFTEEERMIQEVAKKFTDERLRNRVQAHFRDEQGPTREIIKEMGEQGLLGVTIPEKYGGAGASATAYGLVAREVEKCDSGYRSTMSVQTSLVMWPIYCFGSDALKERLLPQLAAGDLVGCFGLTEPDAGSDPAGMRTFAKPDGDDYIISGSKTWITNSPIADVFMIWAVDTSDNKVKGFVLEKATMQGISAPKIEGKFSLRASPTGMIMMDEVRVPKANMLPNVVGMKGPFSCLNSARLGAAEDCLDKTRQYLLDRKMFKRPLASNQILQKKMAEAWSEITIGLQFVKRVTDLKEDHRLHSTMISMAKRNSCTKAIHIARECRDMLGGNGIVDEYGVIRHVLNLEAVNTYEGTQDIHALILGRAMTGIQAFAN